MTGRLLCGGVRDIAVTTGWSMNKNFDDMIFVVQNLDIPEEQKEVIVAELKAMKERVRILSGAVAQPYVVGTDPNKLPW